LTIETKKSINLTMDFISKVFTNNYMVTEELDSLCRWWGSGYKPYHPSLIGQLQLESLKLQPQLLLRAVYVMNVLFQLQMKIYHLTTITRLRLLHLLNVLLSPQELSE